MSLQLQEGLFALVKNKYNAARATGALSFAESQLSLIPVSGGRKFQLRYCPSLAQKPPRVAETPSVTPKKRIDPFLKPEPQLFVTNAPNRENASHVVVLNKFPIIQNHFILATSSDALKQDQLLAEDDLLRTYECLKEWESKALAHSSPEHKLFSFFNSGEYSGASQPHRHIQFLPVEDMREPESNLDAWNLLMDDILSAPKIKILSYEFHVNARLPFMHFGLRLPRDCSPQKLWSSYMDLMKAAIASVRRFQRKHPGELSFHKSDGHVCPISYNLGMTTSGMVICARRNEGREVTRDDGTVIETVALNGTLLGGTLMVKNQEVFDLLRADAKWLEEVLKTVGIPAETGYEGFEQDDLIEDITKVKFSL